MSELDGKRPMNVFAKAMIEMLKRTTKKTTPGFRGDFVVRVFT